METLLAETLAERARAVEVPGGAWVENVRRVRRDRGVRAAVATAASVAVVAGGAALATAPRSPNEPAILRSPSARPTLVPDGHVDIDTYDGRLVDLYLEPRADGLWACAEVRDGGPKACEGPALDRAQPSGAQSVMVLTPLRGSGLPVADCELGPLGNLQVVLTSPGSTGIAVTYSGGGVDTWERVGRTEGWPVEVYAGVVPRGQSVTRMRALGFRDDFVVTGTGSRPCEVG